MFLHEYQSKLLLKNYNILVPNSIIVKNKYDISNLSHILKENKYVLKVQVHSGGRKKHGGIKIINTLKELENFLCSFLHIDFITNKTNKTVQFINSILIEEYFDVIKEIYCSIIINKKKSTVSIIASEYGGVEIEANLLILPDKFFKIDIFKKNYLPFYRFKELAINLNLHNNLIVDFSVLMIKLINIFFSNDLNVLEINPLSITKDNKFVCLDAKFDVDNNALYRQKHLLDIYDFTQNDSKKILCNKFGFNFIHFDGNIGCIVNGAELAMATFDLIKIHGGSPANFLDIGSSVEQNNILQGLKIILFDKVDVVFINIFGGIVKCDMIANCLISIINSLHIFIPVVVRLIGNKADMAVTILLKSRLNIYIINSFSEAVIKAVSFSKENGK